MSLQNSGARIPILDLGPEIAELRPQLQAAFERILASAAFISGPDVKLFEDEVARYLNVKHAIALNSGTDALVIALRAMGVGPGDEVIVPAFTFFATAECVSILGATPVIVDVDPTTFNISPALVEKSVTKKTKAIIPVHLFGQAAQLDELQKIAARHGLKIIEDVAQAFGGTLRDKKLGAIADASAFSFFPSKNVGAFGDGGLLATNDDALADMSRMLRFHGCKKKYHNEIAGYNSRLDTMQAAFLRVKLPHIDKANDGRRRVAHRYAELLAPLAPSIVTPQEVAGNKHVFHQYTIRIKGRDRDAVQSRMAELGVDTMIYYPKPLHKLPLYEAQKLNLPVSEMLATEVLSLPIWPQISMDTQKKVVDALAKSIEAH